ncbi:MAG: hypothetical protein ACOX6G_10485 [Christensenellales bacterium]|jgi:hypothetical protein
MTKYEKKILTLLKKAFEQVAKEHNRPEVCNYECGSPDCRRHYYVVNPEDNLSEPMNDSVRSRYEKGNGNELKEKMRALRSSSALTYNLFGNKEAKIKAKEFRNDSKKKFEKIGEGTYAVGFEEKYPTLFIPQGEGKLPRKIEANLDAFLYCEKTGEAIAIEMKMLEWILNSPGRLRERYLSEKNYLDKYVGRVFCQIANQLISKSVPTYSKSGDKIVEYTSNLTKFDAFQMFKHAIACYSSCSARKEESQKIKKLTLINCMWTLPTSKIPEFKEKYCANKKEVQGEFETFYNYMREVKSLFKRIDKDFEFDIILCSFNDFLALLEKDKEELDYLRRYTFDGLDLTDK